MGFTVCGSDSETHAVPVVMIIKQQKLNQALVLVFLGRSEMTGLGYVYIVKTKIKVS